MEVTRTGSPQRRTTVLLLEDEMLPALTVEEILSEAGYDVVGPVPNVREALALLRSSPVDAAILDLNLNGEFSYDVGARCDELGIPWGITTGYARHEIDASLRDVPILNKPFGGDELLAMLRELLARKS